MFENISPSTWIGAVLASLLAALFFAIGTVLYRRARYLVPGTEEYRERVREQRIKDQAATRDNEVVYSARYGSTDIKVFSGDILNTSATAIVSSDDTLLSATAGVARAVVAAAGRDVKRRLRRISATSVQRGSVIVTYGGRTRFEYILHAVTLTKARDYTEYPSKSEVADLVSRALEVCDGLGVASVAVPVLAGGTAAKRLREEGLADNRDLVVFLTEAIVTRLKQGTFNLKTVFLVVFDSNDIARDRLLAIS